MSKGYMGQVTDRDIEMVNLLIEKPTLSLDELGTKLGITKQAVAERKSRLEENGFIKPYYFWNVTPRFECTKRVRIKVKENFKKINQIPQILDKYNPIAVFFRTAPEEFFEGKTSSLTETIDEIGSILLFNNEEEEKQLRLELEKLDMKQVSIESVLFSRLLGEKCDITIKTPKQVETIAWNVAQQLMAEASVQAVLYEQDERSTDQFDLIIIRDERFQPKPESYERRINKTLLDYHFTNMRQFMEWKDKWLKNMKLLYFRDETIRRKIHRKIKSIQS